MSGSRSVRTDDARRARIILNLASGSLSLWVISRQERCSINTVRLWRDRFKEQRSPGLWSRHRGRAPSEGVEKARSSDYRLDPTPCMKGRQNFALQADRWLHSMGAAASWVPPLGIDHMRVARVWAKAGLQPHRRRHYMVSDDPQFEKKAAKSSVFA
jgi:Homeodomain-like domain